MKGKTPGVLAWPGRGAGRGWLGDLMGDSPAAGVVFESDHRSVPRKTHRALVRYGNSVFIKTAPFDRQTDGQSRRSDALCPTTTTEMSSLSLAIKPNDHLLEEFRGLHDFPRRDSS